MSPEKKALIQATWQRVAAVSDAAAQSFYDRLFDFDPTEVADQVIERAIAQSLMLAGAQPISALSQRQAMSHHHVNVCLGARRQSLPGSRLLSHPA